MGSPLGHLVLSRIRESLRHPEAIFWTFVFPALLAIALGIAFQGNRLDPASVVVVASGEDGPVVRALSLDNALRVERLGREEADGRLRSGRAAIVVVPGNPLVYRFDPSRSEALLAREIVDAALQRGAGREDPVETADEPAREPGSRYIDFLIPGLLGMNILGGGAWGVGWVIAEMRMKKLLKLMLATPMRRSTFLSSHVLARLVYLPLEVVPLLLLARLLFGVSVAGSYASLAVAAVLGAFAFSALGLLLASRARTNETIMGLINLCTLPMFVLSGVFFSTSRFPEAVQPLIRALPLTVLIDALRAVMTEGTALAALWPQCLLLGAWGAASLIAALWIFRWS